VVVSTASGLSVNSFFRQESSSTRENDRKKYFNFTLLP
jgi:hypothetical protein